MAEEVLYRGNNSSTYNDTWLDEDNPTTQYRAAQQLNWGRLGATAPPTEDLFNFEGLSAPVDLSQSAGWNNPVPLNFGDLESAQGVGAGVYIPLAASLLATSYERVPTGGNGHGQAVTATAVSVGYRMNLTGPPDRIYAACNMADENNYHGVASLNQVGGELRKVVGGTVTSLGTFSVNDGDDVRLDRVGNELRVYVNGTQVLTAAADVSLTSTKVGLVKHSVPGGQDLMRHFTVGVPAALEGQAHPFIEWDLFNDTPVNGSAIAAGAVVQDATLRLKLAKTLQALEIWPMRSGRYAGADAPEWASSYPNWERPSSTALTSDSAGNFWSGATTNLHATALAVIQAGEANLNVSVTSLVQDAIDNNNGVLQVVGLLPAGGTSDHVQVLPYDILAPAAQWPELEITYEPGTSVGRLVLPPRNVRHLVGGRLV